MVAAIVLVAQLGLLLVAVLLGMLVPMLLRLAGWLLEVTGWLLEVIWWLVCNITQLLHQIVDVFRRRIWQRRLRSVKDDRYLDRKGE